MSERQGKGQERIERESGREGTGTRRVKTIRAEKCSSPRMHEPCLAPATLLRRPLNPSTPDPATLSMSIEAPPGTSHDACLLGRAPYSALEKRSNAI